MYACKQEVATTYRDDISMTREDLDALARTNIPDAYVLVAPGRGHQVAIRCYRYAQDVARVSILLGHALLGATASRNHSLAALDVIYHRYRTSQPVGHHHHHH